MKTKFFIFLFVFFAFCNAMKAETVKLSFSGVTTEGRYCLLDSVKIENLSENWAQTLDCAQDTTFELNVHLTPTSIDNISVLEGSGQLLSVNNSYYGSTLFALNPLEDGIVNIRVADMHGRIVMEHVEYLCAGIHQYDLQLSIPQVYILYVKTNSETASAKIISMGHMGDYHLARVTSMPSVYQAPARRQASTDGGDSMRYTGYTNQKGVAVASEPITQNQSSSENIVLHFAPVTKFQEGMYVSLMGFNNNLYPYAFDILTSANLYSHQNFVSNLSMSNGTILYHAVYTALDNVVKAPVPEKLENVSLVTFTDGLDIGSWRMNSNYPSEALYLAAVNKQINRTCIDGVKLDAYAIGVQGNDVTDIVRFENDLQQLASDPANVYNVSNMDEVNARFREIAAKIYNTKVNYSLSIKLPAPEPGSLIRFTFDDIANAANSIYYIEGTYDYDFNANMGVLKDVVYSGIKSSNVGTWTSTPDGIFDIFTINDLTTNLGERVNISKMRQWAYIPYSNSWQINSEFDPLFNSTATEERTSAIVMLVLDCSSSLGSDFSNMQSAANTFLSILAGNGNIYKPSVYYLNYTLGDLQASLSAMVTSTGNLNILDKGFCVSEKANMDNAVFYSCGEGTNDFTYELTGLTEGNTYYFRSYVENQLGRTYSETSSFVAVAASVPSVTTIQVTDVTIESASCKGKVTSKNYSDVTERGFCWSTNPNPTIANDTLHLGSGLGQFSGTMTDLEDGTTYYVRAYAINDKGIGYGEEKSFTTVAITPPTITTAEITNITFGSADCGGNVTSEGNTSVIERGLCWSENPNPTVDDNILPLGSGLGQFSGTMVGLEDETTYYVRAYAKNSKEVVYGEEKTFTTSTALPTVSLSSVEIISSSSVQCIGQVEDEGKFPVIERGFCWGTKPNPTIEDNSIKTDGSGLGLFTDTIKNLEANQDYYIRAYAKNEKGIAYSGESPTPNAYVCVITYTADTKLIETTNSKSEGLHTNAFNVSILSHEFSEGLGKIVFSQKITNIGEWAFSGCSGLTSITIPNSVTSIGSCAFSRCSGLTSITIPNSVTSIGEASFGACTGLTSVTIPNSVTSIGDYAFSGCSGLTSITIPNSVTSIGEGAFMNCSSLIEIEIPYSVMSIENSTFYSCSNLKSVTIPNSVTSIKNWAFYSCSSLTSVTIPNNLLSIGMGAFKGCSSLTSMDIPNSVTSIGDRTFSDCENLISVTLPNNITGIEYQMFAYCHSLTRVTIPNSVKNIGQAAFAGCSNLTSIIIPNSVTSIGYEAFSGCSGLSSVAIGNRVTSIGNYAFSGCENLTSITNYRETPQNVSSKVFSGSSSLSFSVNKSTCTLYVPEQSVVSYKATDVWKDFKNILPINE